MPIVPASEQEPDELGIIGRTAHYIYRTPGTYKLRIPSRYEFRLRGQGAGGGGGGANYVAGGYAGEGGGQIAPGQPGEPGKYWESGWHQGDKDIEIGVPRGGKGGRGVEGLDGGKGADGWIQVEVRRLGLRAVCLGWVRDMLLASGTRLKQLGSVQIMIALAVLGILTKVIVGALTILW